MNILVVGPHPDDQELGMGGTIAKLVDQGHDVLLLDMTNGEPTPYGDPETRAGEAAAVRPVSRVLRRRVGKPRRGGWTGGRYALARQPERRAAGPGCPRSGPAGSNPGCR